MLIELSVNQALPPPPSYEQIVNLTRLQPTLPHLIPLPTTPPNPSTTPVQSPSHPSPLLQSSSSQSRHRRPLPPLPDTNRSSPLPSLSHSLTSVSSSIEPRNQIILTPSPTILQTPATPLTYDHSRLVPSASDALAHETDPFSDEFAAIDPDEPHAPHPTHSSYSGHTSLPPHPRHHSSDSNNLPIKTQPSTSSETSHSKQQEALALTIPSTQPDELSSSPVTVHSQSPGAISRLDTESFDANPCPPESVAEGVSYGPIRIINDPLESHGQFTDALVLSQYSSDGAKSNPHPLVAIEAWSWNRLLTYLMW